LEEAIQLPEFREKTIEFCINYYLRLLISAYNPSKWEDLADMIIDIHGTRLQKMNECGCEYQMLSWTSPGAQGRSDQKEAERVARRANDYMSEQCKKNPKRYIEIA
jgi:predicted TIM-barrel fold metal-dependent hydrolase